MSELNWSEAQWQKVQDGVKEAFETASIANAFLQRCGPLRESAEVVRNDRLVQEPATANEVITVSLDPEHAVNLDLMNLAVKVVLTSEQVAEDSLSNAMLAFRRAANILAQQEDLIVFEGFSPPGPKSPGKNAEVITNNYIQAQKGLADPAGSNFSPLSNSKGTTLVPAIVEAIHTLETNSNTQPFACVLGDKVFEAVYTPTGAMVLPADRIIPLLKGGPLLRSGKMDPKTGIVVSLGGNAIDLVIGTPPTVQFLQRKENARFLFRVYEKFVLRVRDENPPVAGFTVP